MPEQMEMSPPKIGVDMLLPHGVVLKPLPPNADQARSAEEPGSSVSFICDKLDVEPQIKGKYPMQPKMGSYNFKEPRPRPVFVNTYTWK